MKILALLLLAGVFCKSVAANNGAATFGVNIKLAHPRHTGVCISEALSAGTSASVYVLCNTGQYVDIAPTPGQPFAGTHGRAYRYHLQRFDASGEIGDDMDSSGGTGTITAIRIYRVGDRDSVLEMLVSF